MFCDFTSFPGVGGAHSGAAAVSGPTVQRAVVAKNVKLLAANGCADAAEAAPSSTPEGVADVWDMPTSNGACSNVGDLSMPASFGADGHSSGGQPPSESVCPTPLLAPGPAVAAASPVTPASVMSDVFRVPAVTGQGSPPRGAPQAAIRGGAMSCSTATTAVDGDATGGFRCVAPIPKRKITRKRPRKSEAAAEAARWAPAIASQDLAGTTAAASRRMSTEERQLMLHKRKLRNRASAARSRAVARTVVADVVEEVAALEAAVTTVGARVEGVVSANAQLRRENAELREMVGMLRQTVQGQGGMVVAAGAVERHVTGASPPAEHVQVNLLSEVDGMPSKLVPGKELMPAADVDGGAPKPLNPPAITVVTAPPSRLSRTAQLSPASCVMPPATADCGATAVCAVGGPQLVGAACPTPAPVVVTHGTSLSSATPQRSCAPLVAVPPPLLPLAAPAAPVPSTSAPTPPPKADTPLPPNEPEAAALVSTGAYQYEDDALLPPELLEQLALSVDQASAEPEAGANLGAAGGAVGDAKQETVPVTATAADAADGAYPPGLQFSASTASLDTLFASLADGGPRPFSLPRTASMLRMYTWTA